ncbi:LBP / BPI / CETP family protein [Cooperia oncophora]
MFYNLYISRYRCPQNVAVSPAPPNRIILSVQNLDIGITGNLGGQIVFLSPIGLFGIIQINLFRVSINVEIAIEREVSGPYVRLLSCNLQLGYADVGIEKGGRIGDLVNSADFRQLISRKVRKMIRGQICGMLPPIIKETVNGRLAELPQAIAVTQMLSLFSGALASIQPAAPSPQFCQSQCGESALRLPSSSSSSSGVSAAAVQGAGQAPQIPQNEQHPAARALQQKVYNTNQTIVLNQIQTKAAPHSAPIIRSPQRTYYEGDARRGVHHVIVRNKRQARNYQLDRFVVPSGVPQIVRPGRQVRGVSDVQAGGKRGLTDGSRPVLEAPPPVPGAPPAQLVPPTPELCARCPPSSGSGTQDPMSLIRQLIGSLDMVGEFAD